MVLFKDNLLKKKQFVIVLDYMHEQSAVSNFLDKISDEFSKYQPGLIINERFFAQWWHSPAL